MTYFEYKFSGEFIFILGKSDWLVLVCFVLIELSVSLNSVGKINAITFLKKKQFHNNRSLSYVKKRNKLRTSKGCYLYILSKLSIFLKQAKER